MAGRGRIRLRIDPIHAIVRKWGPRGPSAASLAVDRVRSGCREEHRWYGHGALSQVGQVGGLVEDEASLVDVGFERLHRPRSLRRPGLAGHGVFLPGPRRRGRQEAPRPRVPQSSALSKGIATRLPRRYWRGVMLPFALYRTSLRLAPATVLLAILTCAPRVASAAGAPCSVDTDCEGDGKVCGSDTCDPKTSTCVKANTSEQSSCTSMGQCKCGGATCEGYTKGSATMAATPGHCSVVYASASGCDVAPSNPCASADVLALFAATISIVVARLRKGGRRRDAVALPP